MPFTESIKELVLNGASAAEIKRAAIKDGMKSLRMSGITKVGEGFHHRGDISGHDGRLAG